MRELKILAGLSFLALIIVGVLYLIADDPNSQSNGFVRRTTTATQVATLASSVADQIRFAYISSERVVVVDLNDSSLYETSMDLQLRAPMGMKLSTRVSSSARIFFADSSMSVIDHETRTCASLNLYTGTISSEPIVLPFIDAAPLTRSKFVSRVYDTAGRMRIAKYDLRLGEVGNSILLSSDQKDLILRDGQLHVDWENAKVAYVHFYLGVIILMDSSLSEVIRFSTIDTTSTQRIQVFESDRTGNIVLNSPPVVVNEAACFDSESIYVNSRLKADNQQRERFNKYSVIDRYSLQGAYLGSVDLKNPWGKPMRSFFVRGTLIYGEYEDGIAVFTISPSSLD